MIRFRKLIVTGIIALLILTLVVPIKTGQANNSGTIDIGAVDSFLTEQVKHNRIQGLAVGIVEGDRVVFSKGYGFAAPQKPVTPETQFYIGSVSKTFTALAVMQLVEAGKLELDAPVQKYLPWFRVADPETSAKITIRNLLNHTSGLGESGDKNATAFTSSLLEQGKLLKDVQPVSPVGTRFEYYNQNYRLLGLIVETVSGMPYSEYIQTRVFEPLGMTNSTTNPQNAPDLAQGYSRFFGFALPASQPYVPGGLPSGYLISTAEDMSGFLLAQIHNQKEDGTQLLDPELLSIMRTEPAGIKSDYGMGWLVLDQGQTIGHGGSLEFFQSFILIHPKQQTGLVILINQNSLESMQFENNSVRNGLLALLQGSEPENNSYGWIGWVLLTLFAADLLNQYRLFASLKKRVAKARNQKRNRVWIKVVIGIIFPLFIIVGIPLIVSTIKGGSPNWTEPLKYAPDLIIWLLLGMGLNLIRNLIFTVLLLSNPRNNK